MDEGKQRAIVINKSGFPDAVVWNPWIDKAASMADFGDDEYKVRPLLPQSPPAAIACIGAAVPASHDVSLLHAQSMVCLEPAVAGSGAVTLQPGATWSAQQRLSLRPL